MASKSDKSKADKPEEKKKGLLSSVPLGSALDVVDGVGGFLFKLLLQRYQVEEKIGKLKEDAREKAEELKEEAIRTGYALKKAFFRAVVEAVLLVTGMLALIIGAIWAIQKVIPIEYVLLGYGIIVTTAIVFSLKTNAE
jgi:hypothetical protein